MSQGQVMPGSKGWAERYMQRPKHLIFKKEEYEFLHHEMLKMDRPDSKLLVSIQEKEGLGLNSAEKSFVKKLFIKLKKKEADDGRE